MKRDLNKVLCERYLVIMVLHGSVVRAGTGLYAECVMVPSVEVLHYRRKVFVTPAGVAVSSSKYWQVLSKICQIFVPIQNGIYILSANKWTPAPINSDESRARHCGNPAQFWRMPHRYESCPALCPSENLNRALQLFTTQRQWLSLCFKDPQFLSGMLVGPPFHNFRSVTEWKRYWC